MFEYPEVALVYMKENTELLKNTLTSIKRIHASFKKE